MTPTKLPSHDWTISITLREDLNLSHLASDGVDLLDKDVILQGLASFLGFPKGMGLSVANVEIKGPLLARPLKTGEDIVQATRQRGCKHVNVSSTLRGMVASIHEVNRNPYVGNRHTCGDCGRELTPEEMLERDYDRNEKDDGPTMMKLPEDL